MRVACVMCVYGHTCYNVCVQVRGQLGGADFTFHFYVEIETGPHVALTDLELAR